MGALLSIPIISGGGAIASSLCSGCAIFMGEWLSPFSF